MISFFSAAPDSLGNCSISTPTVGFVIVDCSPGADGGLPQRFHCEVYEQPPAAVQLLDSSSNRPTVTDVGPMLLANLTELAYPTFVLNSVLSNRSLTAVRPDTTLTLRLYASNDKGTSGVVSISSSLAVRRIDSDRSIWAETQPPDSDQSIDGDSIAKATSRITSTGSTLFNSAPHFWLLLLIALIGSAILWALFTTGLLLTLTIVRRRTASAGLSSTSSASSGMNRNGGGRSSGAIAPFHHRLPIHFNSQTLMTGHSSLRMCPPYHHHPGSTATTLNTHSKWHSSATLLPAKRAPDLLPPPHHLMYRSGSMRDVKLPLSIVPLPP